MSINELFTTATESTSTNARTLSGTASLTQLASAAASRVINIMNADTETYKDRIQQSIRDSQSCDALLAEFKPWYAEAPAELCALTPELVESMLKSQQSKRSRCKSKAMTLDNYHSYLTAAIAEDVLREIYKLPKSATRGRSAAGSTMSPERLAQLADDQEALRREIRNVQSKKSIMRSKADFSEESPNWQQLIELEASLKSLRIGKVSTIEVDTTKDALTSMLDGVDLEHLKASDAKELLASIRAMV